MTNRDTTSSGWWNTTHNHSRRCWWNWEVARWVCPPDTTGAAAPEPPHPNHRFTQSELQQQR